MQSNYFQTTDFSTVSALLTSSEVKLVDISPTGRGGYLLLLSPKTLCEKLAQDYELRRLVAPAKDLSENIKFIKRFIENRKGVTRYE